MAIVSASRLQVRKSRYRPMFLWKSLRIGRELRHAPGFLNGAVAYERRGGMWTCTIWEDTASMERFRNRGHHLDAMRRDLVDFDEIVHGHWEQAGTACPTWEDLHARLAATARFTRLQYPSSLQKGHAVPYFPRPEITREHMLRPKRS